MLHLFTFPNLLFAGDAGDGGGGGQAGGEGAGGEGGAGGGQAGGEGAGGGGQAGGGQAGGEGAEWTPPTREEYDKLVAANAKAQADARRARTKQEEADRKAAEQNGEFEGLYKGEQERASKLVSAVTGGAIRSEVIAIAGRLGMTNPGLAPRLIDVDGIEAAFDEDKGEATVDATAQAELERRIAKVLEDTPGLAGPGGARRQQVPRTPNGDPAGGGHAAMNDAIRRAAGH